MKPLAPSKSLAAAAFGLLALAATTAAHARSDVQFSIGVNQPAPVYVQPAPVYVPPPRPVYVQPAPVYVQPAPVYAQPQPVYVQPQPVYVQPGYGYRGNGWRERGHHWGHGNRRDFDRDGVPDRFDRAPGNPYRY